MLTKNPYLCFIMKKIFRFYKEPSNRWYIDLPEWPGDKIDLEMVEGADDMLDYVSEGGDNVNLLLSIDEIEGGSKLKLIREATEYGNGSFYFLKSHMGVDLNKEIWLCDVTKFIFGGFPNEIFFVKVD